MIMINSTVTHHMYYAPSVWYHPSGLVLHMKGIGSVTVIWLKSTQQYTNQSFIINYLVGGCGVCLGIGIIILRWCTIIIWSCNGHCSATT